MNSANQTFAATAFHPDFGNEASAGEIAVDRRDFHFRSESLNLIVPLHRLRIRVGAGSDERIYFTDLEQPGWEVITDDFGILDHPFIPQMDQVRAGLDQSATRQELLRRLKLVAYALGTVALIIWGVNLAVSGMVSVLVGRVSPQKEQEIGAASLAELRLELAFLEDSNRVARLEQIVAPLKAVVPLGTNGLQFFIADEEAPNAFAIPGGYVVVTTGLLNLVERPEELLGVLAHELAHVKQKHGIRSMVSGAGPFLMFGVLLGSQRGVVGLLGSATDQVVRSGFSQEYETEADEVGWQLLIAAKVSPHGMIDSFRRLKAYEAKQKELDLTPQALSSHPAIDKRIARLEKKWAKIKSTAAFQDLTPLTSDLQAAAGK